MNFIFDVLQNVICEANIPVSITSKPKLNESKNI